MKGQEHTVMSYLMWAVFFVVAAVLVYQVYLNITQATPTPLPYILDVMRSAVAGGRAGIGEEVCTEVYPGGQIILTEDFIKEKIPAVSRVVFECQGGGCSVEDSSMTLEGRKGTLCAVFEGGKLTVRWK